MWFDEEGSEPPLKICDSCKIVRSGKWSIPYIAFDMRIVYTHVNILVM